MIELQKPKKYHQWLALLLLYHEAFPASERKPVAMILKMYRKGTTDIWCAMENGRFLGLAITINSPDVILIDYLAVEKTQLQKGVGTRVLGLLKEQYRDKGLFLEIENPYADTPDRENRVHRKSFYLHAGFTPMRVMVMLFGVEMELLGQGCTLTYDQYQNFYRVHYNAWAADHIAPSVYPES